MGGVKRKCKFNSEIAKKYSFIKKATDRNESDVFCTTCQSTFSIAAGAKTRIEGHVQTEKHKNAVLIASSSRCLDDYLNFSKKEEEVAAAEGVMAFHAVKHNYSFRSMDCMSQVLKKVYDPAFCSARTKSQAIVENVLAKYAEEQLLKDLEKSTFISVYTDCSNHKDIKLCPILLRYFNDDGIQVKIVEMNSVRNETAEEISDYIISVLTKNKLLDKVVCFCADNTNSNFGGPNRNGTNNIFVKLQNNLGKKLVGVGCAAHILNNTIQTAADNIPLDIESVLIKIYSYLHIYTVRVESLKDYCNYVSDSTEYQKVLGFSKTRWLAFLPAIERLLSMFEPLKGYFWGEEKCPRVIRNFFEDRSSKLWLEFLKIQAQVFYLSIKQVEGQNVSITEVCLVMHDVLEKYESRISDEFIPLDIIKLVEEFELDLLVVKQDIILFYKSCVQYLKKWISPFTQFSSFSWLNLKQCYSWNDVSKSSGPVNELNFMKIDDNELYDDYVRVKQYCSNEKIQSWNDTDVPIDKRWIEIFNHLKSKHVPCSTIKKFVELILCFPGTNAPTERVFSLVNNFWTSEKNSLQISMLKPMLIVKMNLNYSCSDFYDLILTKKEMLKSIRSSQKYLTQ